MSADQEDQKITRPKGQESLQEEVEKKEREKPVLFGTASGVFIPTLLTILGVIMYLREGWVVGNAGLAGAWLIIILSFSITACTGLSLSSVTTNIKIGAGGAFSVISQSLGLEVGGSVGIPLYLAQALAVTMYIFGFRAGWLWMFPGHSPLIIDIAVFLILFIIAFISAGLAFKIQYLILAAIIVSLVSIGVAAFRGSMQYPVQWWGRFAGSPETGFSGTTFWAVFAVFFPASTGIMAGANMSGELKNPRRSIPLGTLGAIGLSLVIYLLLAYWLACSAPTDTLMRNYTVMIDKAAWGPLVIAGLLGATFSSALSSMVGSPRILQALGSRDIIPAGKWFAARTKKGEPRNALFLTGAIVLGSLLLRNLNAIAPLITMFFLITYAMINVVVLIEQRLGLVSFRPLFKVPRLVPLTGALGCVTVMFIINPVFGFVAVGAVLVIHMFLIRKHLRAPYGDVRSGLLVAVAEWAAKKVNELTVSKERTWKANLLVPAEDPERIQGFSDLIKDLAYPKGFLKIVGLTGKKKQEELDQKLPDIADKFSEKGLFASWTVITAATFGDNLKAGIETFGGTFFKPNILFMTIPEDKSRDQEAMDLLQICKDNNIGAVILDRHEKEEGKGEFINVWLDASENEWQIGKNLGKDDLAMLVAYKLKLNRKAELRLVARTPEKGKARSYLRAVAETARIPNVHIQITGTEDVEDIPEAFINILSVPSDEGTEALRQFKNELDTSVLFTMDSGAENALA